MDIYSEDFDSGIGFLDPILENPRFDYTNWSTLELLIGELRVALMTWDSRYPGFHEKFVRRTHSRIGRPSGEVL